MKEFDINKVKYYLNIGSHLVPVVHGGDWVKVEDFSELLETYTNLKNKEKEND